MPVYIVTGMHYLLDCHVVVVMDQCRGYIAIKYA